MISPTKQSLGRVKKVHLIAICGMGMGSLAGLLKEKGFEVTGSDDNIYPPMSTQLESLGIPLYQGYRPENLSSNLDLVIVGNAVSRTNPEVTALLEGGRLAQKKIPTLSMPQALFEFFLKEKTPLVVAGTHGKTTTASLLAWILNHAGRDAGFLIGGILKNFKKSYHLGGGPYFVVEGDEYDTAFFDKGPKFVHYAPQMVLLGPVEFDHADIYKDLNDVMGAFEKLIPVIPPNGFLVACADSPQTLKLASLFSGRKTTYGFSLQAEWRAEQITFTAEEANFQVVYRGKRLGSVRSPLAGRHNIQNLLGVIALTTNIGFCLEEINRALARFESVKRRQEVRGTVHDVIVVDDFAHHPTAIAETITAIRSRYPGHFLWALFEPRSNTSRRNIFQGEFVQSLAGADEVVIADLYQPEKIPAGERLDPQKLAGDITQGGTRARFIPAVPEIVSTVVREVVPPAVLLVMSNGGFGGIHSKLLETLKERFQ
ncbi:MAG: UDP-N-acetylmuramate:L-alanyl-gamma-D-glutamyl-meso-diaminopimelate ligase [Deltaproteobacteria bacterium]|nr:UDP-N-acetylmuramate:L-alanyl-gamma-D-glutamyl-meso-diaminopimelate ligase [Deltaproteobacteria bacterium]